MKKRPNEKKEKCLEEPEEAFCAKRKKEGKQREPVSGANGLSFRAVCYQQYGFELGFRDYLKEVFSL